MNTQSLPTLEKSKSSSLILTKVLLLFGIVMLVFFKHSVPLHQINDLNLAVPVIKGTADPSLYPESDLIVFYGMKTPFFFYQAISGLVNYGYDPYLLLSVSLLCLCFVTPIAFWFFAQSITKNDGIAFIATLAFFLSPPELFILNGMASPCLLPISTGIGLWLSLIGLGWIFRRQYTLAALLGGGLFFIHPGQAVVLLTCLLSVVLAVEKHRVKKLLQVGGVLSPFLLTFVYLFAQGTRGNTFDEELKALWNLWQYHIHLRDHLHQGYWSLGMMLLMTVVFLPYLEVSSEIKKAVAAVILSLLALVSFYVVNLYFLEISFFYQWHLFRVGIFLKPLCFVVIASGIISWLYSNFVEKLPLLQKGFVILAVMGLFLILTKSPVFYELKWNLKACAVFLSLAGFILLTTGEVQSIRKLVFASIIVGITTIPLFICVEKGISLGEKFEFIALKHLIERNSIDQLRAFNLFVMLFCLNAALFLIACHKRVQSIPFPKSISPLILTLLILGILFQGYANRHGLKGFLGELNGVSTPNAFTQMNQWLRQSEKNKSMVLADPLDLDFLSIRVEGETGLWINIGDINQLSYNVEGYRLGHQRLKELGVILLPPSRTRSHWRREDYENGFLDLSSDELLRYAQTQSIDYIVLNRFEDLREMPYNPHKIFGNYELYKVEPVE